MEVPSYIWGLESSLSFTGTLVGHPYIAQDAALNTYFVVAVDGTNTNLTSFPTTLSIANIAVGCVTIEGTLLWYQFFPELIVTTTAQSQPCIVIGTNNDLYVSFTTPGSTANNFNMANVPIFCPCINPGPLDVVLARINYTSTGANVAWVVQNARINSCANEQLSRLAIDAVSGLVYIVLQTSGTVNCFTPIGTTNLVLSCFTTNGVQQWLETQALLNGTGQNTNPAISADTRGGVYVAFESTSTGTQQIQVVKFQTTASSYTKVWSLSGLNAVGGQSSAPSISMNLNSTQIFLGFLTTGSVGGNSPTGSAHDMVAVAFTPAGTIQWIRQGTQFNQLPYTYADAAEPYVTVDQNNNMAFTLLTYSAAPISGQQSIFLFKLKYADGSSLYSINGFNNFPIAYSGSSFAILPSSPAGSFTQATVNAPNGYLTIVLGTQVPLPGQTKISASYDIAILNYELHTRYLNISPFTFMTKNKLICTCGAACSCSSANP
jgi:hypothetical protein